MRTLASPGAPATEIVVVESPAAAALEGARRFASLARETLSRQDRFSAALSGGSTPKAMHGLLAKAPWRDQIDWARVHVFWGDERFVPPNDPESSYRMAQETLLAHVPLPPENIHPMPTVGRTPEQAARLYAAELQSFFGSDSPHFDLVFLGLGPDGHTASLFPSRPPPPASETVAVVMDAPKPPPIRLTLTCRVFNRAAHVLFLAEGSAKAEAVRQVFDPAVSSALVPAKTVRPAQGTLSWILDEAAAAKLGQGPG